MFSILRNSFTWYKMFEEIRKTIATCDLCQKCKYPNYINQAPMAGVIVDKPNQKVAIDFVGALPSSQYNYTYFITFVDCFSKHVKLYPLRKATAKSAISKLHKYIEEYGKMSSLVSDRGTQFTGHQWQREMEKLGIKHHLSSTRHPKSNPAERQNRTIIQMLRLYVHDSHYKWNQYLEFIEDCMNNAINHTTGYTPHYLQTGKTDKQFWHKYIKNDNVEQPQKDYHLVLKEVRERIVKKFKGRKSRHDKKLRQITTFEIGDLVLVKANNISIRANKQIEKFFKIYEGPFSIRKRYGKTTYLIQDSTGRIVGTHHINNLRKYIY